MDDFGHDWIFQFSIPDETSRRRAIDVIRQMRVADSTSPEREADLSGDLDAVMGRVWAVVLDDFYELWIDD